MNYKINCKYFLKCIAHIEKHITFDYQFKQKTRRFMNLTDLEKKVMVNIAESEYIDVKTLDELVDYTTWSFVATDQTKQLTGALSSLVKKGLVGCDQTAKSGDETCWLTRDGVAQLKSFYCYI